MDVTMYLSEEREAGDLTTALNRNLSKLKRFKPGGLPPVRVNRHRGMICGCFVERGILPYQ